MPLGVIKINPAVFQDKRDALGVAWNEALRLWMEDHGFQPRAEPTKQQREILADTAYADDEEALRKTILARIATRDTSAGEPTDEQLSETAELLRMVLDSLDPDHKDRQSVEALLADVEPAAPEPAPTGEGEPGEETTAEGNPE